MTRKKRTQKKSKKAVVLLGLLLPLVLGICFYSGFFIFQFNHITTKQISKTNEDLGIKVEAETKIQESDEEGKITNFALFGVDSRYSNDKGNSDAIIVASIDTKTKKIKLCSVLRDTYVKIEGVGMAKINAAYAYGGPQLAIKTLNQNFNLGIKDYFTVDFFSLAKIIDALGGVDIDVKQNEINNLNKNIREVCDLEKSKYTPVTHSGLQTLTGKQAVGYSRIRYVGNNDFERTDRQRRVLTELFNKIEANGVVSYPSIVAQILPNAETSMTASDIISIGTKMLTSGTATIEQQRFPVDGYWNDAVINGEDVIKINISQTSDQMFSYIFNDVQPAAK